MNFSKRSVIATYLALSLSSGLSFSQEEEEEERAYDASISLGYVGTSGNTETSTFNAEALLTWRTINWTHNGKIQMLRARKEGTTDADRFYLEEKSDYNLDEHSYLFGKGTYTDDKFSGFNYQASASAGYGRKFIQRDNFFVEGFVGLGYRESEVIEVIDVINDKGISEGIISVGESLEWNISDSSKFVQTLSSEIGEEATVTKFEIGLEANIIGNLATKIAFELRNTSRVPEGIEKTDTLTSVSLVYTF